MSNPIGKPGKPVGELVGKLRLGFYPYTYARVSVMKGDLIKPIEWHRLLKMGVSEILVYMQNHGYKTEVDTISAQGNNGSDIALLEMALNKNLMRTLTKLRRISDEKLQHVLRIYLERYDMENFKTILRGKCANISQEEVEALLLPSVNYPDQYFENLIKKEKISDVVKSMPFKITDTQELFKLENDLDHVYYEHLLTLTSQLSGQGAALQQFVKAEMDILNIKMLLRLKKSGIEKKEVKKYLIHPSSFVLKLSERESLLDITRDLKRSNYIPKFVEEGDESELLKNIEINLDTALLKKEVKLMHQFPLTANVMLGFMFAKEIEVKNLKVLLKGKQLQLDEPYLEK